MSIVLPEYNLASAFSQRLAEGFKRDEAFERKQQLVMDQARAEAMTPAMRLGAMTGRPEYMQRAQQALEPRTLANRIQVKPIDLKDIQTAATGGDVESMMILQAYSPGLAQVATETYHQTQQQGIKSREEALKAGERANRNMMQLENILSMLDNTSGLGPTGVLNLAGIVSEAIPDVLGGQKARDALINLVASPEQLALRNQLGSTFAAIRQDYGRLFADEIPGALERVPTVAQTKEQIEHQIKAIGVMSMYDMAVSNLLLWYEGKGNQVNPQIMAEIYEEARLRTLDKVKGKERADRG